MRESSIARITGQALIRLSLSGDETVRHACADYTGPASF
ncbi:protein of unknown function [Candidatus Nitrospira inopinata]|uniref:Uncharacterized protein n=1 Tax=Candidatus Nitrospira inopinata TaxID=1715989 RepID=A0A0S4KZ33_9BACT|nr:protein of unknown function [Candidatus Nitrospira inopinata]